MAIQAFHNLRTGKDSPHYAFGGRHSERVISTLPEFLKEAGRDYSIVPTQAFQRFPGPDGIDQFSAVDDQYHLVRSVDQRVVSPSTVSGSYDPLSLVDVAEEIRGIVDAGWATPDAVYDARNGSLEMMYLRLDAGGDLPDGEKILHYMVFVVQHGLGKANGKILDFRPVCANTFAAAVRSAPEFAISHRKAKDAEVGTVAKARLAFAVEAWESVQEHIRALSQRIETLSAVKLGAKDAADLASKLFGISDPEKASANATNKRDFILAQFRNPEIGTYGRTGWDFYNAVTNLTSQGLPRSKVSATDRMVRLAAPNGTGASLESDALRLLASVA